MQEEKNELNPIVDTTRFVNIDKKAFDIYIEKKLARHLEASEEDVMPVFVAQVGAKHLVDRILQEQGIGDTNTPSAKRDHLLAKILPDVAEEIKVVPMSEEDYRADIEKKLEEQSKLIESLGGSKDEKVSALEKEVRMLKARMARRKPKVNK